MGWFETWNSSKEFSNAVSAAQEGQIYEKIANNSASSLEQPPLQATNAIAASANIDASISSPCIQPIELSTPYNESQSSQSIACNSDSSEHPFIQSLPRRRYISSSRYKSRHQRRQSDDSVRLRRLLNWKNHYAAQLESLYSEEAIEAYLDEKENYQDKCHSKSMEFEDASSEAKEATRIILSHLNIMLGDDIPIEKESVGGAVSAHDAQVNSKQPLKDVTNTDGKGGRNSFLSRRASFPPRKYRKHDPGHPYYLSPLMSSDMHSRREALMHLHRSRYQLAMTLTPQQTEPCSSNQ